MFNITFDDLSIPPHLSDRIERGAAWLDANRPGWRDQIDLDEIDLASPCHCVLGQTFADMVRMLGYSRIYGPVSGYGVVWEEVREAAPDYEIATAWMRQHAFENDDLYPYDVLTDAWADYLREG